MRVPAYIYIEVGERLDASGGPEELIGGGGLLVAPDPESVSLAMSEIWNDKAKLEVMRAGALVAARQFDPDFVADKWVSLAQGHTRPSGSDSRH